MTMFDLTPYGGPEESPKPKPAPSEPVVVELGVGGWGLVTVSKHPEAHLLLDTRSAERFKAGLTHPDRVDRSDHLLRARRDPADLRTGHPRRRVPDLHRPQRRPPMTIVDNATLDWAKTSHPNETVREVAGAMLAAGPRPIDIAERLAELIEDERSRAYSAEERFDLEVDGSVSSSDREEITDRARKVLDAARDLHVVVKELLA